MAVLALIAHRDGGTPPMAALTRARARLAPRARAGAQEVALPHARAWVGFSLLREAAHVDDVIARDSDELLLLDGRIAALHEWRESLSLPPEAGAARVVLELWRARGCTALAQLRGHFAVTRLSAGGAVVQCARDVTGQRPLYLRIDTGNAFVASEAMAVLDLAAQPARADERSAARFFALRAPANDASFFAGVGSVAPGSCLRLDSVGDSSQPLAPPFGHDVLRLRDRGEYAQAFGTTLVGACRALLDGEPAAAIALSGGIDSTTIAAAATLAAGKATLHAVSWSLPHFETADEWPLVQATALALSLPAREVTVIEAPTLARAFIAESPIANPYRALKHAQYATARKLDAEVLLSGNFGDHAYPDERGWLYESWHARRVGPAWRELLARAAPWLWLRDPGVRGVLSRLRPRRDDGSPEWLTARARALVGAGDAAPSWQEDLPFPDRARRMLAGETALDAVADTPFADRAGLSVMYPYRDIALLDLLLRVPADLQFRAGEPKALARAWLRGRVPDAVRRRPKSGSLTPLFRATVRGRERAFVERTLFDIDAAWPQYVERAAVTRAWERAVPDDSDDLLVWLCLSFEAWRRAAAGEAPMLGFRP